MLYFKSSKNSYLYINFVIIFTFISLSRLVACFYYIDFSGDQIRDQLIFDQMKNGVIPYLGPASSIGNYSLLPYYYYLTFVFSMLGPSLLSGQVFFNALSSSLGVFSFGYLVYRLTNNKQIGLIGTYLWCFSYSDVLLNNKSWNPSSAPFYIIAFILLLESTWKQNIIIENNLLKLSLKSILFWFFVSFIFIILMSLHSSTMFVVGILYPIYLIAYSIKFKSFYSLIVSFISSNLLLLPYWLGELKNNFANTANLLVTLKNNASNLNLTDRLKNIKRLLVAINEQGYSFNFRLNLVFIILSGIGLGVIIINKKKLNQTLLIFSLTILGFYLIIASNFTGTFYIHFWVLISYFPLLIWLLNLNLAIKSQIFWIKLVSLPLLLVIIWYFYLFGSFNQTVQYLANKYGPNPKANTNDYIQTINSANNNDIICTNNNNHQVFEFLLKYRNPTNKSLLLKDC